MPEYEIVTIGKPTDKTSQAGKQYRLWDLEVKGETPEGVEGDTCWVNVYWNEQKTPQEMKEQNVKLVGEIVKAKYGDGWELKTQRQGQNQRRPFGAGGGTDVGLVAATAALGAASRMFAGTLNPEDAGDMDKLWNVAQGMYEWCRKRSDGKITHEQRKKLFALMTEKGEKELEQKMRDLDRAGELTKQRASQEIEKLQS